MPITYIEAMSQMGQRGIETLQVAQDAQVATLRAARDAASGPALVPAMRNATEFTNLALAMTCRLMAQQAAFAKDVVEAFAKRVSAAPAAITDVVPPADPQPVATILLPPFASTGPHEIITDEAQSAHTIVELVAEPEPVQPIIVVSADETVSNARPPRVPTVSSNSMPPKRGVTNQPKRRK